jgi:acyl carrier protein
MKLDKSMTKDEIYLFTVNTLHEMFEIEKSKITPQSHLYTDLDIDSIDAVDIVVKLNQMTGKRIQPEIFKTVRTVQNVVDVLANLLVEDEQ